VTASIKAASRLDSTATGMAANQLEADMKQADRAVTAGH
jgi:hypothetical protein